MVVRLKWAASAAVIAIALSGSAFGQTDPNAVPPELAEQVAASAAEAAASATASKTSAAEAATSAATARSSEELATKSATLALNASHLAGGSARAARESELAASGFAEAANTAKILAQQGAARAKAEAAAISEMARIMSMNDDIKAYEELGAGADSLFYPGRTEDGASRQPISRAVDGCLAHPPTAGSFDCAVQVARGTARIYRAKAGRRQHDVDATTTVSVAGLGSAVIGGVKAAASTTNAWIVLGVTPIVVEDLASAGPRGRLYGIAAISLSRMVWRYAALVQALRALDGGVGNLRGVAAADCDANGALDTLKRDIAAFGGADLAFADTLDHMSARCEAVQLSLRQLAMAQRLWIGREDYVSLSFAKDVIEFDDTVARLDRSLRSSPSEAFRTVLSTPFAVATDIIRGGGTPGAYPARTLAAFSNPIVFEMTRLPAAVLPAALPGDLEKSAAIDDWSSALKGQPNEAAAIALRKRAADLRDELNALSTEVNMVGQFAGEVARLNDLSNITINFSVVDRPVQLQPPPPAT